MQKICVIIATLIPCLIFTKFSNAGMILQYDLPSNTSAMTSFNVPNNDNDDSSIYDLIDQAFVNPRQPDFNWIFIQKEFQTFDPIDTVFHVGNSQGTTEFLFISGLVNHTENPWTDYHVELGLGTGNEFIPFIGINGLDFDFPEKDPAPFSYFPQVNPDGSIVLNPIFETITHQEHYIDWENGIIPIFPPGNNFGFGDLASLNFSIDIPDSPEKNEYIFTLRQFPSASTNAIPEPNTVLLLASGLLGTLFARRKFKFL